MFKRDIYLKRLTSLMHNGRLKIVTGIRRCGKSYLLDVIFRDFLHDQGVDDSHIVYISFDDITDPNLLNPLELNTYLRTLIKDDEMYYFLLDEVQRIYSIINPIFTEGRIEFCKDMNDERAIGFQHIMNGIRMIKNADVYITGSNSKFLSKDILSAFRDRGDEIYVQPLSFKEIVEGEKPASLDEAFNDYMTYGGMPVVQTIEDRTAKMKYLSNLFDVTYRVDVEEHNRLAKSNELATLARIMADNVGSLTNPNAIENSFNSREKANLTKNTIANYLSYLEEAFILRKVYRFDIKGRNQIGANYKYYFTDVGLRNALSGFLRRDSGHVMENIVFNELVRRGFSVQVGVVNVFEKNRSGKTVRKTLETDFIATIGNKIYYIQSAYALVDDEKIEQERKSLLHIDDSFKKVIITRDRGSVMRDDKGILYLDIIKFLLDEDSLDL